MSQGKRVKYKAQDLRPRGLGDESDVKVFCCIRDFLFHLIRRKHDGGGVY